MYPNRLKTNTKRGAGCNNQHDTGHDDGESRGEPTESEYGERVLLLGILGGRGRPHFSATC